MLRKTWNVHWVVKVVTCEKLFENGKLQGLKLDSIKTMDGGTIVCETCGQGGGKVPNK